MKSILAELQRPLEVAAESVLKLPNLGDLDEYMVAASVNRRITVARTPVPVSIRNYEIGQPKVSHNTSPACVAFAVNETIEQRGTSSRFAVLEPRYKKLDIAARLLARPGLQKICNHVGVMAVTVEHQGRTDNEGKVTARASTKHAIAFVSPDDIEARSQELFDAKARAIGVRFVEANESPDLSRRVGYLAERTVPVFNDGIESIFDVISWCAMPPDAAGAICDLAKSLHEDSRTWPEARREEAYQEFEKRLSGISPQGITDIATRGVEAEAAGGIRRAAVVWDEANQDYTYMDKLQLVQGIQSQLAGASA